MSRLDDQGRYYHDLLMAEDASEAFICNGCDRPVDDGQLFMNNGEPYCSERCARRKVGGQ